MATRRNFHGGLINATQTIVRPAGVEIEDARNLLMAYDENANFVVASDPTKPIVGIAILEAGINDISGVESGKVPAGEDLTVQIKDIGFVIAGAEIKEGQEVTTDNKGMAAVATTGNYVLGMALNSVSAGGYCEVQIMKYQKN